MTTARRWPRFRNYLSHSAFHLLHRLRLYGSSSFALGAVDTAATRRRGAKLEIAASNASPIAAALLAAAASLSTADAAGFSSNRAWRGGGVLGSGGLVLIVKENGVPDVDLGMGVATTSRPWRQASINTALTSSAGRAATLPQTIRFGVGVDIAMVMTGAKVGRWFCLMNRLAST